MLTPQGMTAIKPYTSIQKVKHGHNKYSLVIHLKQDLYLKNNSYINPIVWFNLKILFSFMEFGRMMLTCPEETC